MKKKVKMEPMETETVQFDAGSGSSSLTRGVGNGEGGSSSVKKEDQKDPGMVFTSTTEFTSRLEVNSFRDSEYNSPAPTLAWVVIIDTEVL